VRLSLNHLRRLDPRWLVFKPLIPDLFSAGASAGILPLVRAIGVGPANTIAAGIGLVGVLLVLCIIKWGEKWGGRDGQGPEPVLPPAAVGEEPSDKEEKIMEQAEAVRPVESRAKETVDGEFKERRADERRPPPLERPKDGLERTFSVEPATPM
jgi:hypothetical protein